MEARSPARNSGTSSLGKRLAVHAADLYATGAPVVLAGDYNVVPTDRDIYPTKSWDKDALLQPESRAAYAHILAQGWVDAIRMLHPNEPMYTFWDYKRQRWERDAGLRLDHILLSPSLVDRLRAAGVDRGARGKEDASHHAPVLFELREASKARRASPSSLHTPPPRNPTAPHPQHLPMQLLHVDPCATPAHP